MCYVFVEYEVNGVPRVICKRTDITYLRSTASLINVLPKIKRHLDNFKSIMNATLLIFNVM